MKLTKLCIEIKFYSQIKTIEILLHDLTLLAFIQHYICMNINIYKKIKNKNLYFF